MKNYLLVLGVSALFMVSYAMVRVDTAELEKLIEYDGDHGSRRLKINGGDKVEIYINTKEEGGILTTQLLQDTAIEFVVAENDKSRRHIAENLSDDMNRKKADKEQQFLYIKSLLATYRKEITRALNDIEKATKERQDHEARLEKLKKEIVTLGKEAADTGKAFRRAVRTKAPGSLTEHTALRKKQLEDKKKEVEQDIALIEDRLVKSQNNMESKFEVISKLQNDHADNQKLRDDLEAVIVLLKECSVRLAMQTGAVVPLIAVDDFFEYEEMVEKMPEEKQKELKLNSEEVGKFKPLPEKNSWCLIL